MLKIAGCVAADVDALLTVCSWICFFKYKKRQHSKLNIQTYWSPVNSTLGTRWSKYSSFYIFLVLHLFVSVTVIYIQENVQKKIIQWESIRFVTRLCVFTFGDLETLLAPMNGSLAPSCLAVCSLSLMGWIVSAKIIFPRWDFTWLKCIWEKKKKKTHFA